MALFFTLPFVKKKIIKTAKFTMPASQDWGSGLIPMPQYYPVSKNYNHDDHTVRWERALSENLKNSTYLMLGGTI